MKKIRSFFAALLLMVVLISSVHSASNGFSLRVDNDNFGFWFNPFKDRSFSALSENITDNTILVLGSSEFRHGRNSIYHPRNALANIEQDLMFVGGAGNQILFHSILTGAIESKLEKRKVILIISPTWFKKDGVNKENYGARFSESEYIRFMQNSDIDINTKKYIAKRSEKLLADNGKYRSNVRLIDRHLAENNNGFLCTMLFRAEEMLAFDRDRVSSALAVRRFRKKDIEKETIDKVDDETFDDLLKQADEKSKKSSDNPLNIPDKSWNKRFSKAYRTEKGKHTSAICSDSQELDDLRAFLEVCRQTELDVKLIILPVNGRWYDHVGTGEKQRRETTDKIIELAKEYDAEASDLTVHEYEPFITKDSTHPWHRGWVFIDKEIYDFSK